MTQKEMEDKLREINICYSNRAGELMTANQIKVTEIEGEIINAKTDHDKKLIELHEEYQSLNTKEIELRRQGLTHLSVEVDGIRKKKDENKNRQRHLQLAFCQKMHELKIRRSAARIELNQALNENAQMRNKAKKEAMAQLNK